jgi:polyisoprenoid-binding protein YceI
MFKQLFPVLLIPMLLLGAGCASVEDVQEEVIEEVVVAPVFEDGSYVLQSEASSVAWTAKKRVGATHNGTIQTQEGALIVQEGGIIGGSMIVDMNSIIDLDLTDEKFNEMLVTHLKSADFFGVETYPTATFAVSEVVALEGIEGSTHRIDGTLTIKDIENDISFAANLSSDDAGIHIVGMVTLDRTLWDIRYGSGKFFENLGDGLVEDEFQLDVDMLFARAE